MMYPALMSTNIDFILGILNEFVGRKSDGAFGKFEKRCVEELPGNLSFQIEIKL